MRIDQLKPGSEVMLSFDGAKPERAVFVRIKGEDDERHAQFVSMDDGKSSINGVPYLYVWDAYRFQGRWVYGSGANRLTLVDVITENQD